MTKPRSRSGTSCLTGTGPPNEVGRLIPVTTRVLNVVDLALAVVRQL
jgi:hypothetical protein